jgi:predicted nucleotidyltransferase
MDKKNLKIATELKENISDKYRVDDLRVFGSVTRRQQDRESDMLKHDLIRLLHMRDAVEEAMSSLHFSVGRVISKFKI